MLRIINARNQRGWDHLDDRLDDTALADLIGSRYETFAALRRAADRASESYATVEYADERTGRTYRYDESARLAIPGRHGVMVTALS